jgi:hypothetical protein
MIPYSEQTLQCLRRAGWTPGSIVDITTFEALLTEAGFCAHDAALTFLREFGGLRIQYPHAKLAGMTDDMHFDPSIIVKHVVSDDVDAYGKVIGRKLCPIGEAARGYLVLMMDEQGAVYGAYDDFFAEVADSGPAAIESLCSGKELKSIPVGNEW